MPLETVVVDDVSEMRELLRTLLRLDGRFSVVGEAADGEAALEVVGDVRPQVVLLDIDMPRLTGIDVLPGLRALVPAASIVVLSGYRASEMEAPALARGAIGYIEKSDSWDGFAEQLHSLVTALERVRRVLDVTYGADPASAAAARRDLRRVLAGAATAGVLDVVELLTTELVGNAIRHAHRAARVSAHIGTGRLRVSVTDDGPGIPVVRQADPDAESGRGLELVELLSEEWGVEAHQPGKTVWFEIPL